MRKSSETRSWAKIVGSQNNMQSNNMHYNSKNNNQNPIPTDRNNPSYADAVKKPPQVPVAKIIEPEIPTAQRVMYRPKYSRMAFADQITNLAGVPIENLSHVRLQKR